MNDNVRLDDGLESAVRHLDAIRSRGKVGHNIDAFSVRLSGVLNSGGVIHDHNLGAGYRRARRIEDEAIDGRVGGLRDRGGNAQHTQEKKEGDLTHAVSPVGNRFGHTYPVYAGDSDACTTP